jgi:mRNA-degrading endonuclease HigB of HigAB toxin-antitoxin module
MGIPAGTYYEANQKAMTLQSALSPVEYNGKINEIALWFSSKKEKYFMFLCHDIRYYTLFHFNTSDYFKGGQELKECFENNNFIITDIHYENDLGGYEIWLRVDSKDHVGYLFSNEKAVIEI